MIVKTASKSTNYFSSFTSTKMHKLNFYIDRQYKRKLCYFTVQWTVFKLRKKNIVPLWTRRAYPWKPTGASDVATPQLRRRSLSLQLLLLLFYTFYCYRIVCELQICSLGCTYYSLFPPRTLSVPTNHPVTSLSYRKRCDIIHLNFITTMTNIIIDLFDPFVTEFLLGFFTFFH